ncbi:MAG: hypothetical protein HN948_10010 [Clostridia bacterium]|jgi:hypothetical protein|nr:hypothetical protein [Clostridia bacterium]MBT7123328.1 hypothetical protein [Clostridia bacterium]
MNSKLRFLISIIIIIVIVIGCSPVDTTTVVETKPPKESTPAVSSDDEDTSFEKAIVAILEDRLTAIQTQDYDLYMSVITRNNQFFYNEQERWFENMIDSAISDVSLQILSTRMLDELTGVVTIRQKHRAFSESFDIEYPLLFKFEHGKWMDYGYHFEEFETDRFVVKYMEGETRVAEFVQMLDAAFDNLDGIYELKPLDDYEMKLFFDREMLRQRCIPANPWLFTGWSEPDESLKIFTGHPKEYAGYPGVVQHELVHHISIRICNNNLPVWMLEGIAMYDGSSFYGLEFSSTLSDLSKKNVSFTIEFLESTDLGSDLSSQQIRNYYNTSYMIVRYISETYGHDTLMKLFYEAGKKPFHDSTLNKTFEQQNQKTADEVIMSILDLTKAQLSEEYLLWLDTLDFDNLG